LLLIISVAGLGFYLYKGMYNFGASSPHNKITEMVINESMEMSVKNHAKDIIAPELGDQKMINEGFVNYDAMCAMCHGAPGLPSSVLHKGLYPKPPELYEEDNEWSASELFWITKNGIKMTGMPAYDPTHSDEELWAIVAFLRVLPKLSGQDYKMLVEKNKNSEDGHSPNHGSDIEQSIKLLLEEKKEEDIYIHKDGSEQLH
jgi:mono/diheme cytochrome c family protein